MLFRSSGKPIPNVSVFLEGTRWRATTGEDGAYRLVEVTAGTYTLTASRIGYAKQSQPVTVAAGQEATVEVRLEVSASPLDAVVVTGTMVPTEVKALPTPISVVTGDEIAQKGYQRVDQIFRGDVPGAIAWEQGPSDYFSTVTVRGASTLHNTPSIKTFIDGVEVAEPTYIALIDPTSIDRIEITRGPQASTLYGAGALNGVLQIFTKKGAFGLARPEVMIKTSLGGIGGFDGQNSALQTDNALSVLGGDEKSSYSLDGSYRHSGDWVPNYNSTDFGLSAGGQTTRGPLTLSTSARYSDKTFDLPWDKRFQAYTRFSQPLYQSYNLRQQTYGATASVQATSSWQHALTVGYDQTYYYENQTQPRFTTPSDSFLHVTAFHEAKTSLLYHTDLKLRLGAAVVGTLTGGVDFAAFDYVYSYTGGATRITGALDGSTSVYRSPWTSTGYFGQVQVNVGEQLFLTGGLRAERNPNFGADYGTAWSPRVGAAYVLGLGRATVKLRASYGEGIRAPDPGLRDARQDAFSMQLANPFLAPERQRGFDGGVEIYAGRASIGVTYYSQRAIDLVDQASVPPPPGDTLFTYQYQNLSRVKNDGWEFEGRLPLGHVQLTGTYSITTSRVQQLPPGFGGDYRVGDRILGAPQSSAGTTITYSPLSRTTLTASMTHIGHWTNLDYVSFFGFIYGHQPFRGSVRAYWMEYPTVTKFALSVSQVLTTRLSAFARAENLGNNLNFEGTNNQNLPKPRSLLVGATVRN